MKLCQLLTLVQLDRHYFELIIVAEELLQFL
jgi:hypothetical protein